MIIELKELILLAKEGDEEAFLKLCEQKGQQILYVCLKMMGNQHDGEDAAQEVFLKMKKNLSQLKEPAAFSVWLNKIIMNTCLNLKKNAEKEKGNFSLDSYQEIVQDEKVEFLPTVYLEEKEKREQLLEVISQLSPKYKSVILMYYYEGLSQKEIANVMNVTENVVEHSLRRARVKIKKALEQAGNEKIDKQKIPQNASIPIVTQALNYEAGKVAPTSIVEKIVVSSQLVAASATASTVATGATISVITKVIIGVVVTAITTTTIYYANSRSNNNATQTVTNFSSAVASDVSVPQQVNSVDTAGEELDIDDENENGAKEDNSFVNDAERGENDEEEIKVSLVGQIIFENLENSENLQTKTDKNKYLQGLVLELKNAKGKTVATAQANEIGEYEFSNIKVVPDDEYTIQIKNILSENYEFSEQNPEGKVSVVFGKQVTEVAVNNLYIKSSAAPSMGFLFYNDEGERTSVNPTSCKILISDVLGVSAKWEIIDKETSEVIVTGGGDELTKEQLAIKINEPIKEYYLRVTAVNNAGYTTVAQENFIITGA